MTTPASLDRAATSPAGADDGRAPTRSRRVLGAELLRYLVAATAGAVAALGFAPADLSAAVLPGVAVGLAAMAAAPTGRRGAATGMAYAAGFFAVALAWSTRWGVGPWLGFTLSQALFWAPVGWLVARQPRRSRVGWTLGAAAAWTLAEAARARFPLGGLEWAQLAHALADWPVRAAASLAGGLGLTFLAVTVCAGVVAAAGGPPSSVARRLALPLCAVVVLVGATMLGGRAWTTSTGHLDVAIVQVAPICPGQAAVDCPGERERLLARFAAGTAVVRQDVDLVVWGEGAVGGLAPEGAGEVIMAAVEALPAPLLAGVTSSDAPGRFHNRNVLFTADGEVAGRYAKRHPVPFGEFVPARELLGGFYDAGRLVPRDMVRGTEPGRLDLDGVTLGTVSSWEVSFARQVRASAPEADAVAVLTTQASYGDSPVSDQLLAAAQLRAAELQRSVMVAATTGRSTVIGAGGARGAATELMTPAVAHERVELRAGATPYARAGDVPAVALAAVLLLVPLGAAVTQRPRTSV